MHAEIKAALAEYHDSVKAAIDPLTSNVAALTEQTGELQARLQAAEQLMVKLEDGHSGAVITDPVENRAPVALAADGQRFPIIRSMDRVSRHFPAPYDQGEHVWNLADYVRRGMGMEVRNDVVTTGTALVPAFVGSEIIDAMRAHSTVVRSGAGTIVIPGPTTLLRIESDPTVYEHTEGAEDISESTPTFAPVAMDPKALVAVVPLSQEVVSDSANLDAALNASLGAAFGGKLDSLCLNSILGDLTIPSGAESPNSWPGVLQGVGSAMALNQDVPKALIGSEQDFITRASALAATSGVWLGKPGVLADMLELPTTKLDAGSAIMGDFIRGLCIAVRQGLQVELIRFGKYKSYTHLLVAHMRTAGYVIQPGALYIMGESSSE